MRSSLPVVCLLACGVFAQKDTKDTKPDTKPDRPICPKNSVHQDCGSPCPAVCGKKEDPASPCMAMCVSGCQCKAGYQRVSDERKSEGVEIAGRNDPDNFCVPEEKCAAPEFDCTTKEVWTDEKTKWCCKNKGEGCVKAKCPKNSHYQDCGKACPAVCGMPAQAVCIEMCVSGCQCDAGYQRFSDEDSTKGVEGRSDTFCVKIGDDCPMVVVDPEPYNCMTKEMWSEDKAKWCCANKQLGCKNDEPTDYNCMTKEMWTDDKKKWCCAKKGMGCVKKEVVPCDEELRAYMSKPIAAGAKVPQCDGKLWQRRQCWGSTGTCECVDPKTGEYVGPENADRTCPDVKEEPTKFDCKTREMWTDEKKEWCCKKEQVGCDDVVVGKPDDKGCSGGYTWCEADSKCFRVWEEDCGGKSMPLDLHSAKIIDVDMKLKVIVIQTYDGEKFKLSLADEELLKLAADLKEKGEAVKVSYRPDHQKHGDRKVHDDLEVHALNDKVAQWKPKEPKEKDCGHGYMWCPEDAKCIRAWESTCGGKVLPLDVHVVIVAVDKQERTITVNYDGTKVKLSLDDDDLLGLAEEWMQKGAHVKVTYKPNPEDKGDRKLHDGLEVHAIDGQEAKPKPPPRCYGGGTWCAADKACIRAWMEDCGGVSMPLDLHTPIVDVDRKKGTITVKKDDKEIKLKLGDKDLLKWAEELKQKGESVKVSYRPDHKLHGDRGAHDGLEVHAINDKVAKKTEDKKDDDKKDKKDKKLKKGDVCKSGGVETGKFMDRSKECPKRTVCKPVPGQMAIGGEVDHTCQRVAKWKRRMSLVTKKGTTVQKAIAKAIEFAEALLKTLKFESGHESIIQVVMKYVCSIPAVRAARGVTDADRASSRCTALDATAAEATRRNLRTLQLNEEEVKTILDFEFLEAEEDLRNAADADSFDYTAAAKKAATAVEELDIEQVIQTEKVIGEDYVPDAPVDGDGDSKGKLSLAAIAALLGLCMASTFAVFVVKFISNRKASAIKSPENQAVEPAGEAKGSFRGLPEGDEMQMESI